MKVPRRRIQSPIFRRCFSVSLQRREVREIEALPERIHPSYKETPNNDLLSLRWPSPPRNILLVKKNHSAVATDAIIEFARHVHSTYPNIFLILEPHTAAEVHSSFPFPIYTHPQARDAAYPILNRKVDMTSTFGGDGTILHASSLFATTTHVPPILSFSMGTLGFLGEWKFTEYKRAFREVYMSGAGVGNRGNTLDENPTASSPLNENAEAPVTGLTGWSSIRGKSLGSTRGARVLLRNRLKVSIHSATGSPISRDNTPTSNPPTVTHALNELIIHRGADPHLAIVEVSVGGRFLTEAVADGMIVSTPTGSTAYSLSSGGSIIHPLVPSLLLTPICPRSLSFRPLVLPANAPVTLRLSEKNRGREVEVSVDGARESRNLFPIHRVDWLLMIPFGLFCSER
ncbi:poly atp nad kinase [Lasallia pustulata]|uniref:Poly atp nad kinase n=1 Tax=Lasallia pustulata TaxID=136370 RepID=A0A1W5D9B0_9LECA|nr:poly atp nad kinase [Lasallia pustulata]